MLRRSGKHGFFLIIFKPVRNRTVRMVPTEPLCFPAPAAVWDSPLASANANRLNQLLERRLRSKSNFPLLSKAGRLDLIWDADLAPLLN